MIKFFRHIRQSLIEQNKMGKYFKYAIGEIILVVLGILIAIQLNEWQNNAQNLKQKQNVLSSLKAEFTSNKSQLDEVLSYHKKIQEAYPIVMNLIKKDTSNLDSSIYPDPLKNLSYGWTFNPINGALRSAISSGEIHLINNNQLVELLFSWEDIVKDAEEEGIRTRLYQTSTFEFRQKHIRIVDPWVKETPGLLPSNYTSNYKSLFKDPLFEDYASISFLWSLEYTTELSIIEKNNLEILKLIEQELEQYSKSYD